ncbi:peptide/nickel transport system substrate-binding protein [Lipingzhangella halophila]|uniref:Peptide/nickel transport system substrate-binding protein n=1 Tax=Lipingzhangella halophila TaxID=1783352 RepID=A0A7W7RED5_9ACTN|nr:ABC transporter substrate-binding protein [Lipingzhangella halophila]MBB4930437.1 peptide/nickel transport system substrate-binding protein [Lipingzhangella halophila]
MPVGSTVHRVKLSPVRRIRAGLAAVLVLPLVATACADPEFEMPPPPQQGGQPQQGGSLSIGMPSDTTTINPFEETSYNTHERLGLVYGRLLRYKTGPDQEYGDLEIEGDLAEDWDISDDGLRYTFHLREDVTWQDVPPVNGRDFTADDVVATLRKAQQEGFQAALLGPVENIEAPDDNTVVLELSDPFAPLLNNMANHTMWIVPREGIEGEYDLGTTAIGTGPFIMEHWRRNIETSYSRNPDYWEDGKPYLDEVTIQVIPDQASRIAAFRAGETQLMSTYTPEEAMSLASASPDVRAMQNPGRQGIYLNLNHTKEPFDDIRVRRAMSMAIDREGMGESLFNGGDYTGPVHITLKEFALSQDELAELQPHDPERARELLAEAGYPDGFSATLKTTPGYGQTYVRATEWVVEDLARVGIEVEMEMVEYATYFTNTWPTVDYEISAGPQTPFLEPDEWLRAQHHSEGYRNWYNIDDPEVDQAVAAQAGILDPEVRAENVRDAQRYLLEEVVNPIQIWSPSSFSMAHPTIRNLNPQPVYGFPYMRELWLADEG